VSVVDRQVPKADFQLQPLLCFEPLIQDLLRASMARQAVTSSRIHFGRPEKKSLALFRKFLDLCHVDIWEDGAWEDGA